MRKKRAKAILITGVAGSGKSSVAQELLRQGYPAYNIEEIEGLFSSVDKTTHEVVNDRDNDNLESIQKSDHTHY